MIDCPDIAVGYDTFSDFYLELPDNARYFPSNFIGKGQSGYVFNFEMLNDQKTKYIQELIFTLYLAIEK